MIAWRTFNYSFNLHEIFCFVFIFLFLHDNVQLTENTPNRAKLIKIPVDNEFVNLNGKENDSDMNERFDEILSTSRYRFPRKNSLNSVSQQQRPQEQKPQLTTPLNQASDPPAFSSLPPPPPSPPPLPPPLPPVYPNSVSPAKTCTINGMQPSLIIILFVFNIVFFYCFLFLLILNDNICLI